MDSQASKQINVHIRWMIRRDHSEVVAIENQSFEFPWSEDDFIRCLRQRNCIGMVAEHDDRVVGFHVFEMHQARLHILNFAVHPDYRRRGIGRQMLDGLSRKLTLQRRNRIVCEVRETNLDAQLFFYSQGYRVVGVIRDFYEDSPEDAYLFQYRLPSPSRLELEETY